MLRWQRQQVDFASSVGWVADTYWSRMRGLLGRPPLQIGEALLIVPCNAIHCWFMTSIIDVVFLDKSGEVVRLCHHVKPWAGRVCWSAAKVVELTAGEIKRLGLQEGDRCA